MWNVHDEGLDSGIKTGMFRFCMQYAQLKTLP